MMKLVALAALVASASAANKTTKFDMLEKPDMMMYKEDIIDMIESKINSTKFLVKEAEYAVKDTSFKAEAMDMLSAKLKAFNLTKLKAMKDYEHEHAAFPKANLTLVKPVLQLDILKPNKTALKMEIEHMIVKDSKTNY